MLISFQSQLDEENNGNEKEERFLEDNKIVPAIAFY